MLPTLVLAAALVVPMHVVSGTYGEPRLGLDVAIGSDRVRLLVDTGSMGLRLLAHAVKPSSAVRTGKAAAGSYASTLTLAGEEASAALMIGGAHGDRVPIELVDSYHFEDSTINGTPEMFGGAFPGIIGIGMQVPPGGGCCTSPLPALENGVGRRYIVRADLQEPQLILDLDDSSVQDFDMSDVGPTGWPEGCITVAGLLPYDVCGDVIFDTGASGVVVVTDSAQVTRGVAPRGATAHLRLGNWNHDFTAGRTRIRVRSGASTRIVVGLDALQRIDLLFDFNRRQLGLRDR